MSKNESNQNIQKPVTYTQIKILGIGSFGKAYLVECNNDKSLAVIKTMIIENMDEEEKKEALLEAKILEKLDHPNIIKFREVFMARKPVFTLNIVMDFADGGDLQSRIKEQKGKLFSEDQIMDWFTQICLAIKHIHDKKILHRDLKSQNIFLTKNGLVKLGDFGIAKCLNYTLDKAKTVVGTPYYLSPEIVENRPYSFKSDIWSLGVLLYEMISLKMPFDASSLPMLYVKIIRGAYNPIPSVYSKELKSLVALVLTTDAEKRASINEILRLPYLKKRIRNFLTEMEYNNEFSSTIIKKYQNKSSNNGNKPSNNHQTNSNPYQINNNNNNSNSNLNGNMSKLSISSEISTNQKNVNNSGQNPLPKNILEIRSEKNQNINNNYNNRNTVENFIKDRKQELHHNNNFINIPISKTPQMKNENKFPTDVNSDSSPVKNVKKKDSEKKDISISEFIKNKKNDKKKTELLQQQSNISNNSNHSKDNINVSCSNVISSNNQNTSSNYVNQNNSNKSILINQNSNESNYFDDKKAGEKSERKNELKEFMKKKRKEKTIKDSQGDIIWMKGMQDIINLNIENENRNEKDKRSNEKQNENNNKRNIYLSNIPMNNISYEEEYKKNNILNNFKKQNKNENNTIKTNLNNYSDIKDKEDYLNVHKMYINLDNIEKELETDEFEINQEDIKINDINAVTRDFNIISDNQENFNSHINNIYSNNYNKNSYNEDSTDNSMIEELRIDLEYTLGLPLFKSVYDIIHDNTDPLILQCDTLFLKGKIRRELNKKFSIDDIEKAIDKIPEIYSIILKEREMMYC